MGQPSFHISDPNLHEAAKVKLRQEQLGNLRLDKDFSQLFSSNFDPELVGKKNCENLLGSVEIPVGVAGPVTVKFLTYN